MSNSDTAARAISMAIDALPSIVSLIKDLSQKSGLPTTAILSLIDSELEATDDAEEAAIEKERLAAEGR